jgi:hypothetical protein
LYNILYLSSITWYCPSGFEINAKEERMAKKISADNSAGFDKSNLKILTERLDDVVLRGSRKFLISISKDTASARNHSKAEYNLKIKHIENG